VTPSRHFGILEAGGLTANLFYNTTANSYMVTVYYNDRQLVVKVFGNGVSAEDYVLEVLEHPEWTILKYA
jgi:hypothetical protein